VASLGGVSTLLLGNGNGSFHNPQTVASGASQGDAVLSDVNGDGRPDIIVTNYSTNTVSVLLNAANGNFTGQTCPIDQAPPRVLSLNSLGPVASITNATTITFQAVFNKPVIGVDPTDFQITRTGTLAITLVQVSPVSGARDVYNITV